MKEANAALVMQKARELRDMLSVDEKNKWRQVLITYKTKIGNPAWEKLMYDIIMRHKYDFKSLNIDEVDKDAIVTNTPEHFCSIPRSKIIVNKHQESNPHGPLHTQRVHLMEYSLKKYFGIKDINELRERKVSMAMISPATGTYLKLFYTHNLHINQAITNDPNDLERFNKLVMNLIKLAPTPEDVKEIGKRVCTCYLKDEPCCHIKAMKPSLIMMPHSIYYLSDKLINAILKQGADIIYTAHILKNDSSGKLETLDWNDVNKVGLRYDNIKRKKKYFEKNKVDYNPENQNIMKVAEWKCDSNQVEFNVNDDKIYRHKNFLPLLYECKNIATKTTVTKIDKYFVFDNMIHASGTITGYPGYENDFCSYTTEYKESSYIIRPGSQIDKINENMAGNLYVHYDKEKDKPTLMRVYKTKVEFMTFRVGQFSLKDKIKWAVGNCFSEKEYMDMTKNYIMSKKAQKIVVGNEAFNGLMESLLNSEKIDNKILSSMWKRCLATFGASVTSWEQVYDIMTQLLYESLKARIAINELENSDIVFAMNNLLKKNNYSWTTRIYDYFFPPTKIEKKEQPKEEKTYTEAPKLKMQVPKKKRKVRKTTIVHDIITNMVVNYNNNYVMNNYLAYKVDGKTRIKRQMSPTMKAVPGDKKTELSPNKKTNFKKIRKKLKNRWREVQIVDDLALAD